MIKTRNSQISNQGSTNTLGCGSSMERKTTQGYTNNTSIQNNSSTCKKSKDPETNWFIYNWKFEPEKISNIITKKYGKFSEDIQRSIEYEEENMFFVCKSNGHRYKFEKASENNFICPKCGELMEYQDNTAIIKELQNEKATYVSMGELKGE